MNKYKRVKADFVEYKNAKFEAGLCSNSPHKTNEIYLIIDDYEVDLRTDEAQAIIKVLSSALWSNEIVKLKQ